MALNWVSVNSDGKTFLPLDNEIHHLCQNNVNLTLESGSGYPGTSEYYTSERGLLYLTNLRLVFLSQPYPSQISLPPHINSVSIPISNLQEGKFVQPLLSANYFKAKVTPVLNGGLKRVNNLSLTFKEGGGFSFHSLYKQLSVQAIEVNSSVDNEQLPLYQPGNRNLNESEDNQPTSNTASISDLPPGYEHINNESRFIGTVEKS